MRLTSVLSGIVGIALLLSAPALADVEFQPLSAHAARVKDALKLLGEPLAPPDEQALVQATNGKGGAAGVAEIQRILDKYCLLLVNINPESRVKLERGPAQPELIEQGWRTFLIKVTN